MPSIDSIWLDTSGLHAESDTADQRCWLNDAGEPISVHFFDRPPDLPASPDDVELLTPWFRQVALQADLGLVELALVRVDHILSLRVVLKSVLDQASGRGRTYQGSLILPFRDFSYVVKVHFREWGLTGAREAVVLSRQADRKNWLEGFVDPSDPAPRHLARNRSEESQYDSLFPNHPLSRLRKFLDGLQASIRVGEEAKGLPLFAASGRSKRRTAPRRSS